MKKGLDYLNHLMWGYRASRTLQVAAGLKLFTLLSEKPQSCDELAKACGAEPEMLEKLLIACCAMGLLERDGAVYRNTELSEAYLVEGSYLYQGHIIAHAKKVWDYWGDLDYVVRGLSRYHGPEPDHENFILGMQDITRAGRGQLFLDSVDLTGRKKLFDVGGGPATYSIMACKKYPQLHAIVFDVPETIALARPIIEAEELADRISVRQGSWETDDFGDGNDVVLFSNVLHGPTSMAPMKLKKAFASMVSGGLLAVQEFTLNDDKTGPLVPALFNVMVGAYSQAELMQVIVDAGFVDVRRVAADEEIGCAWTTALKP